MKRDTHRATWQANTKCSWGLKNCEISTKPQHWAKVGKVILCTTGIVKKKKCITCIFASKYLNNSTKKEKQFQRWNSWHLCKDLFFLYLSASGCSIKVLCESTTIRTMHCKIIRHYYFSTKLFDTQKLIFAQAYKKQQNSGSSHWGALHHFAP